MPRLVRPFVVAAAAILVAWTLACNSLLGIGAATLESGDDGGDAGTVPGELTCEHYCDVVMQNCTGPNAEYLSRPICVSMCPAFEINATAGDTADDSLGCRLFFASAAASTPVTSCRFAGPLGGGHCGSNPCAPFCALDVNYCASPLPVAYDGGTTDCEKDCKGYPYLVADAGDTTLESTDTLNCRLWHLETAFTSSKFGSFHCPHTAQVSSTCQ